jgi:hypothetical protein
VALDAFLASWGDATAAVAVAGDGALGVRLRYDPALLLLSVLHDAEQRARSSLRPAAAATDSAR